jgi:hypothetical protein
MSGSKDVERRMSSDNPESIMLSPTKNSFRSYSFHCHLSDLTPSMVRWSKSKEDSFDQVFLTPNLKNTHFNYVKHRHFDHVKKV